MSAIIIVAACWLTATYLHRHHPRVVRLPTSKSGSADNGRREGFNTGTET